MIEQDLEVTLMLATLRQALEDKALLEKKVQELVAAGREKELAAQEAIQMVAEEAAMVKALATGAFVMGPDGALVPRGFQLGEQPMLPMQPLQPMQPMQPLWWTAVPNFLYGASAANGMNALSAYYLAAR